ncbi:50S ribosomal protein L11 methyltransferase [Infirmifilum sp. NZ]|uniref:50S ribosomal protein L11 methyltransferase n=1 Tax=Infirmifilum sp. NZ TaxID=2926850 RepID=UPI0027981626|nr:methyltransferase [Infirmifilum sp. NZ]UNQ74338.1 methyltransferase [Infirmifilum sp. NZ]
MSEPCPLTESREGKAVIRHCDLKSYANSRGFVDPAWAPVFYNPRMKCSRDLSTVILSAYVKLSARKEVSVIDVMSGTGVRGIRYVLEVPGVSQVILNDVDPKAALLARENVALNGVTDVVKVFSKEAHEILASTKAEVVDLDPFGTPAPFIHPALRAVRHGGLLCATATDLPPLLGIYPSACIRKYFSKALEAEFSREQAVRVLLYFIAREAAKLGRVIRPFYSYYLDHHIRVCVIVEKKERSGFLEENLGFILYNPKTLERRLVVLSQASEMCGGRLAGGGWVVGGPVWIGELWDSEASQEISREYMARQAELNLCRKGLSVATKIDQERDKPPLYYTTENVASTYKLAEERSARQLVEQLALKGYPSSLTHFDEKGFRTTANVADILEAWQAR